MTDEIVRKRDRLRDRVVAAQAVPKTGKRAIAFLGNWIFADTRMNREVVALEEAGYTVTRISVDQNSLRATIGDGHPMQLFPRYYHGWPDLIAQDRVCKPYTKMVRGQEMVKTRYVDEEFSNFAAIFSFKTLTQELIDKLSADEHTKVSYIHSEDQ